MGRKNGVSKSYSSKDDHSIGWFSFYKMFRCYRRRVWSYDTNVVNISDFPSVENSPLTFYSAISQVLNHPVHETDITSSP